MYRIALASVVLVPTVAGAQAMPEAPAAPAAEARAFDMAAGVRVRSVSIPRSILSSRFSQATDDGWPLPDEDRPNVKGLAYGVEFALDWDVANLFLYAERMDVSWPGGYWDELDEDFTDGSYLVPTAGLAFNGIGADYAAEVAFVKTGQTNGWFGLSLLLGAGLGISFISGDIDYWEGTPDSSLTAYEKYAIGEAPTAQARIPRVLPLVDINAGLRFNVHDRVALRFEGGLHNLFYWGSAVSVMF